MIRFAASWALYIIGDWVSYLMYLDWTNPFSYRMYSWLMCVSNDVQGEGKGPWTAGDTDGKIVTDEDGNFQFLDEEVSMQQDGEIKPVQEEEQRL